jgi:hypothetical protein
MRTRCLSRGPRYVWLWPWNMTHAMLCRMTIARHIGGRDIGLAEYDSDAQETDAQDMLGWHIANPGFSAGVLASPQNNSPHSGELCRTGNGMQYFAFLASLHMFMSVCISPGMHTQNISFSFFPHILQTKKTFLVSTPSPQPRLEPAPPTFRSHLIATAYHTPISSNLRSTDLWKTPDDHPQAKPAHHTSWL